MMSNNKWWGYKHINGSLQAKRYFDDRDLSEAYESPFVDQVILPFEAEDREQALEHIKKLLES